MSNLLLALQFLSGALATADQITKMVTRAQNEGRDLTADELKDLQRADDAARVDLEEAIAQAEMDEKNADPG